MNEPDSTRPGEPPPLPPPPPPADRPASPPKRMYRHPRGVIGGVASGFAAYFDIDPVIVRLLWIVALLTGIGLPAYLVCWAVVPKAPSWPPPGYAERGFAGGDTRAATLTSGLLILGLALLIGKGVDGLGDLLLPAALIGFGIYLLNQRSLGADAGHTSGAAAGAAAGGYTPGTAAHGAAAHGTAAYGTAPSGAVYDAGVPQPAEPSGVVTPTVLSLLALGTGVCWALHAAGVVQLSVSDVAAGGLLVVAGGLLASLWFGRARGLIPIGVGLAGVMLVAATIEPWVERARAFGASALQQLPPGDLSQLPSTIGDQRFQPLTLAEIQPRYAHGMGELRLDLSGLDFRETTREVQVQLGVGELEVRVPRGTRVEVHGKVGLGEANALGHHAEGVGGNVDVVDEGEGAGTLRIDFNVGIGEGKVRRAN